MENKLYQDEFEQFLHDEVKQHRMFPSDQVWRNIRTELHGYRSWPALTFIALFIITALTVSTLISNEPHPVPVVKNHFTPEAEASQPKETAAIAAAGKRHDNSYFGKLAAGRMTAETFDLSADLAVSQQHLQPAATEATLPQLTQTAPVVNHIAVKTAAAVTRAMAIAPEAPAAAAEAIPDAPRTAGETVSNSEAVKKEAPVHTTADQSPREYTAVRVKEQPRRNSRFGFQFYVTPSTSYRKLSDAQVKDVIQPAGATALPNPPLNSSNTGVNNVVRHRPAVGLEFGFAVLYNMSGRLKFKTGVQLNVRQYYIETFQTLTRDISTLTLINNRGVETINFYSPYNNNTGYRATQLQNRVYQVSIPLGIQWDVLQGRNWGVNTEASVQPTMMVNNNSYVISTDYKHYTDGNQFMRKWNINTSVGLNLTYRSGNTSWQLGPQVRYQHLPTYSNAYPIKEYLMDYGLRLGFTRQIN